uniref:ADP,ATP carrier protein n=2 Tax=Aegilops tauschii subsp. strangulata TaxID=200361 RepID=A0A453HNV9_AEGTS
MISFPWSSLISHVDITPEKKIVFESISHLALQPLCSLSKFPNRRRQGQTYFLFIFVDIMIKSSEDSSNKPAGWGNHSWLYIVVRISFFLWVALLNLITISSTWARVIDVMDSESGSRLFGFIGAGATLGQLFGSLFAASMAWMGPFLLLFSSLLMELAALSSKGICIDANHGSTELLSTGAEPSQNTELGDEMSSLVPSPRTPSQSQKTKPGIFVMFEGFWLIMRSPYLIYISLLLWLSAVVSSFFYFQKVTIVATTISSPTARRRTFALINSFIAVFILAGQLTLTGHILTVAGVTVAICASPFIAASNLIALAVWPTWVAVAVTETIRKVSIDQGTLTELSIPVFYH